MKSNLKSLYAGVFALCGLLAVDSALWAAPGPLPGRTGRTEILSVGYTVKVANQEKTVRDFVQYIEARGGYILKLYPGGCVVALPRYTPLGDVRKRVASYGTVVDRSLARDDVGERMVVLRTAIRVKERHLTNLYRLFSQTNFRQTLDLEKEVRSVVQQLEQKRGSLRYYQARLANVRITLNFQYRGKSSGRRARPVPWAWIRSLNLQTFLWRFERKSGSGLFGGAGGKLDTPAGFARYEKASSGSVKAISADGVRLRTRSVKNEPRSTPTLWTESVRLHLRGQGYKVVSDRKLQTGGKLVGHEFVSIYRYKNHDFAYLTALFFRGDRIYIVESAGPFASFQKRRKSLQKSLATFRIP